MLSIIISLVIGLIAGYIASILMKLRNRDIGTTLVIGIIGSVVGGFLAGLIGLHAASGSIGSILLSVAGACVTIWAYRRFFSR